jgi:hypothetical protein
VLDVAALRAARFPRWHGSCAIDLSAYAPLGEVVLRPANASSRAVSTGIIVR